MKKKKENPLLVTLKVNELKQLLKEVLKEEIPSIAEIIRLNTKSSETPQELLTREETAKLLKVSLTSLYHWNKDGSLPAQKINHRVYYQKSTIMDKLKVS